MQSYLIKRLLATIPTLFGITLITFLLIRMAPGDPVSSRFDLSGGGPGMDGAGSQDADRLQDTARAKKQLLGMVRHDTAVHHWRADGIDAIGGNPGDDTAVEVMPLPDPERLGDFDGWLQAIALDPRGDRIWTGGIDRVVVALDARSGAVVSRLEGHEAPIRSIAVTADGTLATADDAGGLRIWRPDGAPRARIETGAPISEVIVLDDRTVLVAGRDGLIRSYDLDGAAGPVYRGHIGAVYALAADRHGGFWSGGVDRVLRRWVPGAEAPVLTDDRHGQAIADIAFAGQGVLTACDDRRVRLFPVELPPDRLDGPPTKLGDPIVFEGHHKGVSAVAFGDGGRVWSGGRDETLRLWDAATGRQLAESPYNPGRIREIVAFDGGALAVGDTWVEVPLVTQYLAWLGRTLTLDFGRSFADDEPVLRLIGRAVPITLGLNALAIAIIYLVSIPIGILAAVKRAGWFDNISSVVLFLLYSIPNFWLATLLIMFLSSERNLNILPSAGLASPGESDLSYFPWLWDRILHLVLPITVMVYAGFASLSRYVRTSMLEALSQDYVRTARAKGLRERVVVLKHAFRNALVTIITLVANLLPQLFGGSLIIEVIFSINGMGKLAFDSILSRDYPVIMAITTLSAVLTLLGILISDLLYGVADPRVKVDR